MFMEPFSKRVNLMNGDITAADQKTTRRLSDLKGLVADEQALEEMLQKADPVVYEVLKVTIPQETGHLFFSTTKIFPGKIGREFYFTKGHYHSNEKAAEIYIGLKGIGVLVLKRGSRVCIIEMSKGKLAYIPPQWGHRAVNIATEPFVFCSVYPADAGFDYETVYEKGLGKRIIVSNESRYRVITDQEIEI